MLHFQSNFLANKAAEQKLLTSLDVIFNHQKV